MLIFNNFITLCKYFVDTFIRPTKIEYEDIDLEQGDMQDVNQNTSADLDKECDQELAIENSTELVQDPDILTFYLRECGSNLCYSFKNIIYFGTKRLKYI